MTVDSRMSAAPPTAWSVMESEREDCSLSPLPLGCPELDALLAGGIPRRGITELAGESGSGKTQLCLQIALEAARATEQGELLDSG